MKISKTGTVVLLCAWTALAATTVSAQATTLPEFETGHTITMEMPHPLLIEVEGGEKITCEEGVPGASIAYGAFLGASKITVLEYLMLGKCANKRAEKCKNTTGEEIRSEKEIVGELGYLTTESKRGAKKVALAMKKQETKGPLIAKFECGSTGVKYEMRGCVIGELSEAGVYAESYTLSFEQKEGAQKISEYEPELGKVNKACAGLEVKEGSGEFKRTGLSLNARIKLDEYPLVERIED